jgi:sec1 family domain-containing protein 1
MLNLNKPIELSPSTVSSSGKAAPALKVPAAADPPIWKILVLDQETKDILATVLRVQDLRDIGVTLHVYAFFSVAHLKSVCVITTHSRQLHSSRPPLSDVPAIYFVAPTLTNIRRIAEDLGKGLYESFHLNFSEPLPRPLLEELAAAVAKDGTNELVEQVRTQHIYLDAQG